MKSSTPGAKGDSSPKLTPMDDKVLDSIWNKVGKGQSLPSPATKAGKPT